MSDTEEIDTDAFERDHWEFKPPKSSFARVHSALLMSPMLLQRQQTVYDSPSASPAPSMLHIHPKMKSKNIPSLSVLNDENESDESPLNIIKCGHIAPDWVQVKLQKFSSSLPTLEREETMIETELKETCKMIDEARGLRKKWLYKNTGKSKGNAFKHKCSFKWAQGGVTLFENGKEDKSFSAFSFEEYIKDLQFLYNLMAFGPAKTLSYNRLKIMQRRFQLHLLLNREVELTEASSIPYRDLYNIRKVDNNIHLSACMNQRHLLQFIKMKYSEDKDRIVSADNKTLAQIFEDLHINSDHLSVDKLDIHEKNSTFKRFNKSAAKYNPSGEKTLRTLFLKIDNFLNGEYLAQITKEVIADIESTKYQLAEMRVTVHGSDEARWSKIATWISDHKLHSDSLIWIVQIPMIYTMLKRKQLIHSFDDMIRNIFKPLFEVTLDPSSNKKLHSFLQRVVALDIVGDEGRDGKISYHKYPSPNEWNHEGEEPPYKYYLYYIYANLYTLNKLREQFGFNTFALRPQCGETGNVKHLASSFLLSQSINHGIRLFYSPILQYLYYLEQIGIAVSPLSNNILFSDYDKNPFPRYLQRGLNISLATDDPLLIHYTKDSLLEEYSIAAQVYGLSAIDLCEIARNSVMQSGFSHRQKQQWIGKHYNDKAGAESNDIYRTNVPQARIQFRYFLLKEERAFIESQGSNTLSRSDTFDIANMNVIHEDDDQSTKDTKSSVVYQRESMLFSIDECEVTFVQTPYGNGVVLEEDQKSFLVEMNSMVCSIPKSKCVKCNPIKDFLN